LMRIVAFIAVLILFAGVETGIYHNTRQADINYFRGRELFRSTNYGLAIPYFEKALKISPDRYDIKLHLAKSYEWTKNYDNAIKILGTLFLEYPEKEEVLSSLAEVYSWTKKYDKAIEFYRRALALSGDEKTALRLAEVYFWAGDYKNSKAFAEKLFRRDPRSSELKLLLAKIYHFSGDTDKAIIFYKNIIKSEDK